jgi:hypothetical protein
MSKPTIELNQLRLLAQTQAGTTYAKIIEEVLSYVFLVRSWKKVPTSGCAIPHYTPFGAEYEVWYQEGNLANIVHELTHIACHVGYDNNFLCYHATDAKSIRKY